MAEATFLGVDAGGTKTAYALIDAAGNILGIHRSGSVSHLANGIARATALLIEGMNGTLASGGVRAPDIAFAFLGLPAYGEDSVSTPLLDAMPSALVEPARYRCGNDMICSWAGSLAGADGISVVAGTGSIAYGEYAGRAARAGGWGELIGDEGSAYWIAREGMNLFSRMSDGRAPRGPLYCLVRQSLNLEVDLDLCARIYGEGADSRGAFAQFAQVVHAGVQAGDQQALAIFHRAAQELAAIVVATRSALQAPRDAVIPVSFSGGAFHGAPVLTSAFREALAGTGCAFEFRSPAYPPLIGAALYAARLHGTPLPNPALKNLAGQCASRGLS